MNRQEFEKLDFIKNFIESFDVSYTNLGGYYFNKDKQPCYYLNGALWAFELQQKKVDKALEYINDETWVDEYGDTHCPVLKILEILK